MGCEDEECIGLRVAEQFAMIAVHAGGSMPGVCLIDLRCQRFGARPIRIGAANHRDLGHRREPIKMDSRCPAATGNSDS